MLVLKRASSALAGTKAELKCASLRSAVKSSFAPDQCIGAPWPGAGEGEIKENEAIERGKFAAVQQRIESLAGMRHEIGGGGEARENEGNRPREQAEGEKIGRASVGQECESRRGADLDGDKQRGDRQ